MIADRNRLALAFACLFIAYSTPARADIIFGVSGAGGTTQSSLYTLNPDGSLASTIGPITLGGSKVVLSGIAYDPLNSTLYGTTNSGASFADPNSLVSINTANGQATLIGTAGALTASMQGVAMTSAGVLYGYSKNTNPSEALFQINLSTGVPTLIGPSNLSTSGDGLAVNSSGTIFFASGGINGTLYTLNSSTGAATAVGTLAGTVPSNQTQVKGMVFDGSTMYGINFQTGSPYPADLISIDPASGNITDLGHTQAGLVGLAVESTSIPEPSSFLLMSLAATACVVRWVLRRGLASMVSYA